MHDGRCLLDPKITDLSCLARFLGSGKTIDVLFLSSDDDGPTKLFNKLNEINPNIGPLLQWGFIDDEGGGIRDDLVLNNSTNTPVVIYRYALRYKANLLN